MIGFVGLHQPPRVKCDQRRNSTQVVSYCYPAYFVVEGLFVWREDGVAWIEVIKQSLQRLFADMNAQFSLHKSLICVISLGIEAISLSVEFRNYFLNKKQGLILALQEGEYMIDVVWNDISLLNKAFFLLITPFILFAFLLFFKRNYGFFGKLYILVGRQGTRLRSALWGRLGWDIRMKRLTLWLWYVKKAWDNVLKVGVYVRSIKGRVVLHIQQNYHCFWCVTCEFNIIIQKSHQPLIRNSIDVHSCY